MADPWKLRPREAYCGVCGHVVALGWRSGLLKQHAQAMARRFAENGLQRSDDKRKDIDWCAGGGQEPFPLPDNQVNPWEYLNEEHVDHD